MLAKPLTSEDVAGHRLLTLVFDTSSMQPEDVQKAADAAMKWVDQQMTPADLVAVASIGSTLQVLTDFTSSKEAVHGVLASFTGADGNGISVRSTRARRRPTRRASLPQRQHDRRCQRAGARHVQQRRAPAGAEDVVRGARTDSAEEGHHLLQLRHAAKRHGQPGGAASRGQRRRARQRRDLPGRLARSAGRRPGRQRTSGQARVASPRSPAERSLINSRRSRRSRKR